jgi:hypothetical protein
MTILISPALATSIFISPGLQEARAVPTRSFGAPLWDLAGAVPSLDLNFAATKNLVDATTGAELVTFTRASDGTATNSSGNLIVVPANTPRFDHDPMTGESLGLLVEEQRSNLLLQSNGFDTEWTNSNSSETAAAEIAPDGTNTAWELKDTLDEVNTTHSISQPVSVTSGTTYTWTVWAKADSLPEIILIWPGTQFGGVVIGARFDLTSGTVIAGGGSTVNSITQYPNGWYRVVSSNPCTSTGSANLQICLGNGGGGNYQGDGTGTILVWGAQLEAGAFPTSYIPTTDAAATRAADVASITGSAFSSFYNQSEGTVFAKASTSLSESAHVLIGMSTGSFGGSVYTTKNESNQLSVAPAAAPSNINILLGPIPANTSFNQGFAFTADTGGSASAVLNGGTVGVDLITGIPVSMDRCGIGCAPWSIGTILWNGHIARLTYWPARLPDSTLQTITQ